MAGCIEQPLKRLAGSFAGRSNLIHSSTQRLDPMGGGLPLLQRNTAMNTPATHPANHGQTKPETNNSFKITPPRRIALADLIKQQNQERGLEPLPLEAELLLKRISDGGHSGQFLADAFISAYRPHVPFLRSLGELIKLDTEGFRLFHEILHIRHISGWSDNDLYDIEQQIKAILKTSSPLQTAVKEVN